MRMVKSGPEISQDILFVRALKVIRPPLGTREGSSSTVLQDP